MKQEHVETALAIRTIRRKVATVIIKNNLVLDFYPIFLQAEASPSACQ